MILPSITNKTRSPCRRVIPGQTPCLLLRTVMMALSDPHRHDSMASSLQTLSDQEMFKTFFQGHISQISNPRMSPFFRVHDSASYRRVLQTTVFIILFLRQRLKAFSLVLFS